MIANRMTDLSYDIQGYRRSAIRNALGIQQPRERAGRFAEQLDTGEATGLSHVGKVRFHREEPIVCAHTETVVAQRPDGLGNLAVALPRWHHTPLGPDRILDLEILD